MTNLETIKEAVYKAIPSKKELKFGCEIKYKLCSLCQKVNIPKGRQIYCGSYVRKTGCSYIKHLERGRKKAHKFYMAHPLLVYNNVKKWRNNRKKF